MPAIRATEQIDQKRWDEYVLSRPDASPYHLWAWKESIEQAYGHKAFYFLAEDNDQVVGIFPLFNLRIPVLLNELIALPYCDVGNCLADSLQVQDALMDKVKECLTAIKCKKNQLRGNVIEQDGVPADLYIEKTGKVRMLLRLPDSSETLLASFKSKLRSQIRKAEKNGVRFRWAEPEEVDSFYTVYRHNMRDLGSPPHSLKWFKCIMATYGEKARIGLAEYDGQCIGAGLILSANSLTVIPWASTLREYNRLGPNMLLYWNFLKFSADNSCNTFDFGRSTEGEGTYRFKKQWGALPVPLPWYSLLKTTCREGNSMQRSGSKARIIIASMLKKMPLPVSNFIGPRLRKYISL